MERDPVLGDIDNEYLIAIAETMRLGRRRTSLPASEDTGPSLLDLLRNPEMRTREEAEEVVKVRP